MNIDIPIIKNKSVQLIIITSIVLMCCAIMGIVDAIIKPSYAVKSAIKIILFLGCPLVYSHLTKQLSLKKLFCFKKQSFFMSLFLGMGVFIVIMGTYFSLRNVLDLSGITIALQSNIGVSKNNFVFVSLYISFINSLLEEFFFRGFAFLSLKKIHLAIFSIQYQFHSFCLISHCNDDWMVLYSYLCVGNDGTSSRWNYI